MPGIIAKTKVEGTPMTRSLFDPVDLGRGHIMRNRFMLGPLTNQQSPDGGLMSATEHDWLAMRTRGGFGMMSTCAANIRPDCAQMVGQIGLFGDDHIAPLRRIAGQMKDSGNVSLIQLNHGGLRANPEINGTDPIGPYAEPPPFRGREMSTQDIRDLVESFAVAAKRAETAGFDGVEIHGAHSQILAQFLDATRNQRTDGYGGPLESRARVVMEILQAVRERLSPHMLLGIRLSVERYEINLVEFKALSARIAASGLVDFIDMSLWDCLKPSDDPSCGPEPLVEHALSIKRGGVKIGIAGKIRSAATARRCIDAGADFVILGRAAILHDDFPDRVRHDENFAMTPLPVTVDYLHSKGVSNAFIGYLRMWDGFVADSGRGMYTELGTMVDGADIVCFDDERQ